VKSKENKLEGLICKFEGLDMNFQDERKKKEKQKGYRCHTKDLLTTCAVYGGR